MIIIDTDPGVDDALAIMFALRANLPVEALCTVYGNANVGHSTENALSILNLLDQDVPVFAGCAGPLSGKNQWAQSHGSNGLGGFVLRSERQPEQVPAGEWYEQRLQAAEDGSVTIVAIGPTTNVADIFQRRPDLTRKLRQLIVMGGVFGEPGNVTQYAEFNVYNDPNALQLLLQLNVAEKMILVPANVCRNVVFSLEVFDRITDQAVAAGIKKIAHLYLDYYQHDKTHGGFSGGVMYDLLAVAYLVDAELFSTNSAHVAVNTSDQRRYGETTQLADYPNCRVMNSVRVQELTELFLKVMNG